MLEIKNIQCNMLGTNCYIASNEKKECVIVDCGASSVMECEAIRQYISDNKLSPTLHLLTHGHFDHLLGCSFIYETYGIKPTISSRDSDIYYAATEQLKGFGMSGEVTVPAIGRCVNDGDEVAFGDVIFKVIATPGHSKGSVVYYSQQEKVAFTGDTLFRGSIGRTDLQGGSMFQIIQSLRTLTQLPDDTIILPGHGDKTTLGMELATNPYLDR